jgi:hypothetical protein
MSEGALSLGVSLAEEDLILIGVGVIVAGIAGYVIYSYLSEELDTVTSDLFTGPGTTAAQTLNNAMGGQQNNGSDVMPGEPNEPENQVGYE